MLLFHSLFLLVFIIHFCSGTATLDSTDDDIETPETMRKRTYVLTWEGNEDVPVELKDAEVDFTDAPEFNCNEGKICEIFVEQLLQVHQLPLHSEATVVSFQDGMAMMISKNNVSLLGLPILYGEKQFLLKFRQPDGVLVRTPFKVSVPQRSRIEPTHFFGVFFWKPQRLICQKTPHLCIKLVQDLANVMKISWSRLTIQELKSLRRGIVYVKFYDHSYPPTGCPNKEVIAMNATLISEHDDRKVSEYFKKTMGPDYGFETIGMSTMVPCAFLESYIRDNGITRAQALDYKRTIEANAKFAPKLEL